jgi:hypothetical protein
MNTRKVCWRRLSLILCLAEKLRNIFSPPLPVVCRLYTQPAILRHVGRYATTNSRPYLSYMVVALSPHIIDVASSDRLDVVLLSRK